MVTEGRGLRGDRGMMVAAMIWGGLCLVGGQVVGEVREEARAEARAEAWADASGGGTQVERKTVTVVTENGRTVRKTTTFRNGVETTETEFLDGQGNVIGVAGGGADGGGERGGDGEPGGDDGPWIGLRVQEAPAALRDQLGMAEGQGVVVELVAPGGPAEEAGLRVNDLILTLDGESVGTPADLREVIRGRKAGDQVRVGFLRRGGEEETVVTLGEAPKGGVQEGVGGGGEGGVDRGAGDGAGGRVQAVEVEVFGNGAAAFDDLLGNPGIPEEFKESVREMQERMRAFEREHGKP